MHRPLAALVISATTLTGCLVGNPDPGGVPPSTHNEPSGRDVAYGPVRGCTAWGSDELCGGSNLLDVYPSLAGPPRGTIVWLHGGGFVMGDKTDLVSSEPVMAQRMRGWSVVAVNYRLLYRAELLFPPPTTTTTTTIDGDGPPAVLPATTITLPPIPPPRLVKQPFPDPVLDVAAVMRWVQDQGRGYGLDPERVVVAGHSAGGTLAAMVGLAWNSGRPEFNGVPRPHAWVSMAGWLNLEAPDMAAVVDAISPAGARLDPQMMSPLHWVDASDPPGYVAHGVDDSLVEVSHARAAEFVFGIHDLALKLRVDIVDVDAKGHALEPVARWHVPGKGVNMQVFNDFMDML